MSRSTASTSAASASTSRWCECSAELRRVLLITDSESWQGLSDSMDDICAFDFDERFCCREAVVRSGAVRLVLGALFAGTGDGLRRKRSHRDPPPPVRDELARKAANCLGVLCAHRETAASASAGRLLDRDSDSSSSSTSNSNNLCIDTSDEAAQSPGALCAWLHAHENGAAIVDALLDLLHAPNHFAQGDSLFALSWFLHIDAAERAALRRGIVPRIAALLEAQCAALRANATVSDALESVRVFGLVCLARLVRMERNTSAALSPTAANAAAAQVRAQREAEEAKAEAARAALLAAEADAAAKKAGKFGGGAKRTSVAAPALALASPTSAALSALSLPSSSSTASAALSSSSSSSSSAAAPVAPAESADQRRHRMQHALLAHLPALVPALLCVVAHLRSHQPLLLALDILAATVACEPCGAPAAAAVAECASLTQTLSALAIAPVEAAAIPATVSASDPTLSSASVPASATPSSDPASSSSSSSSLCPALTGFRPALFRLLFEHRAIFVVAAHKSHALPAIGALARYLLESLLSDEARQYSRVKVCA